MGYRLGLNKKGVTEDIIYIVVAVFIAAITLLAWAATWDEIAPALKEQLGSDADAVDIEAVNYTVDQGQIIVDMSDFAFTGWAFALFIVVAITAVMIIASPIFLVVYIIVAIMAVLLAGALSNAYGTALATAALATAANDLPITTFFMAHLPEIMFVYIVIIGIIAYAKFTGGTQQR